LAPVTDCPMMTLTPLILERNDLLVFELSDHFTSYIRSRDHRIAGGYGVAIGEKEHVTESDFGSGIGIELFDNNDLTRTYPVLFASRTNDRVCHDFEFQFWKGGQAATPPMQ
jgi:hypothetical protein